MALVLALLMAFSLFACGKAEPLGCEGNYVGVAMKAFGVTVTGEDAGGFEMVLEPGGKGSFSADGKTAKLKWELTDSTITVNLQGTELVGSCSKDRIDFTDFLGTGADYIFAIDGSEVAKAVLSGEGADLLLSDLEDMADELEGMLNESGPRNIVVADNELLKIVIVEAGVFQYNPEWIGLQLLLTNKTDRSMHFTPYAEEYEENTAKNPYVNSCYLGGEQVDAELGMVLNPNVSDVPAFLTIKGLTDPAQVTDVSGNIRVVFNDDVSEAALIGYFPYYYE